MNGGEFSLCNQMLLALQLPQATLVAGFRQWLKAGRCVRKGEHGASIWVPIGGRKVIDETGTLTTDTGGDKPGFIAGSVFDIGQTDELSDKAMTSGLELNEQIGRVACLEMAGVE